MDLTEFLMARIAEDEATAREAPDKGPAANDDKAYLAWDVDREPTGEIALARSRFLAECEAKRRIVDLANYWRDDANDQGQLDRALEFLALPYAAHPDYREDWRP